MARMKDSDLRDLIQKRRDAAFKHVSGELARARREAMQFYRGDNLALYGDSGDGLSTVVSRDTMEAIEAMMPSLIKPFVSGDEIVRFEPTGPEDEDAAKQATEYINYLFYNHNDGFRVVYDSTKDGLLFRYGAAKVVLEESTNTTFETYRDIDETELAAIDADEGQKINGDILIDEATGLYTVEVQKTAKERKFRVIVIPPERFLHESRIASLDDATFLAHHDEKPVGDLIAMGLDKAKCDKLQPGMPRSMEDDERNRYDNEMEALGDDDPARKVWVDECYIRCDYEGDGTLRWRKVVIGGNDDTILLNEEADDHPFEGWTPIPEPHKLIGMGIFDLTKDIQTQKTAIRRENLNALYLANRPMREVVNEQVNIDDLLSPSVGGFVRVKAPGMIREIPSGGANVMQQSLAMLEALDSERESRTGVTRYNQGMDANSLNKTATGVSIITNAAMQRQELIARQYAESFLKGVFRKMLKLVSKYQDKAQVIRLRGEWVEMDPTDWKTGYDMSIAVGLGTGNKDQQMAHLTNLMGIQAQIAEGQGGPNGPVVTWTNIYEAAKQIPEAMGLKGVEKFFTDPERAQGEPEGDPAAEQQAQAQQQAEQQAQMAAQAEQERHAAELDQKHRTAVETATIDADAKVRVASIGAVKELVVAGLTPDEAEMVVEAAPDVFAGPNAAGEGEDMPEAGEAPEMGPIPGTPEYAMMEQLGEMPEMPGEPEYDIDPSMGA